MRKIILTALIAAVAVPSVASAQSAGEVRRSQAELQHQQDQLRDAQRRGDRGDIRKQREDVRDARQELRGDWQDYRRSNRDVFRGGNWRAPFRYHSFSVGARIDRNYYDGRYAISDPARYRLRAAAPGTRWVRHFNDVLLVNTRTGRVLQVNRNFFW